MVTTIAQVESETGWQFVVEIVRILAMTEWHDCESKDQVQNADAELVASCLNGNEDSFEKISLAPNDSSTLLGNLLETLSVRNRLVQTLLYWDGCSIAETAELTGWSQSMVKVQAYRARRRVMESISVQKQILRPDVTPFAFAGVAVALAACIAIAFFPA